MLPRHHEPGASRALSREAKPITPTLGYGATAPVLFGYLVASLGLEEAGVLVACLASCGTLVVVHRRTRTSTPPPPSGAVRVIFYSVWTATFLGAVVIARQWPEHPASMVFFGVSFLSLAVRALHYDFINLRYHGRVFRRERPIRFWFFCSVMSFTGVVYTSMSAVFIARWSLE